MISSTHPSSVPFSISVRSSIAGLPQSCRYCVPPSTAIQYHRVVEGASAPLAPHRAHPYVTSSGRRFSYGIPTWQRARQADVRISGLRVKAASRPLTGPWDLGRVAAGSSRGRCREYDGGQRSRGGGGASEPG